MQATWQPVDERRNQVAIEQEPARRCLDPVGATDAPDLARHLLLLIYGPQVLDYAVREHDVELVIAISCGRAVSLNEADVLRAVASRPWSRVQHDDRRCHPGRNPERDCPAHVQDTGLPIRFERIDEHRHAALTEPSAEHSYQPINGSVAH